MALPPDESLRWIVTRYARLRSAHREAFADVSLVEPTAAFFPDEFRLDLPSLSRLLRRMVSYAPISDSVAIELAVAASDSAGGCCASASCGPSEAGAVHVEELPGGGYRLRLGAGVAGHPTLLTAALACGLGSIVELEAGESDWGGAGAEVTAVACGFGVLLLNGSAVWSKACGGLRVAHATALSASEISVALALFLGVHGHAASRARADLGATQREALALSLEWGTSNDWLVETLRDRPALLEGGIFELEPVRGAMGRWLHRRKTHPVTAPAPPPRLARSDTQQRRFDEARALVEEVLGKQKDLSG